MSYLIPPSLLQFWEDKAKAYGPSMSGALFGAGWWFWVDAVACSSNKIPFTQYLPGIVATLALIMINLVRREDLSDYDPFDDGGYCRSRFWLFISYMVSFGAVAGGVWVLLQDYAFNKNLGDASVWPGVAVMFQVTCILASSLLFFLSRTGSDSSYMGYGQF